MKYTIITSLCILSSMLIGIESGFALSQWQSYEEYIAWSEKFCDDSTKPWWKNNTLVPKIDYPELTDASVNATITKWRDSKPEWMIWDEKSRLRYDLDPVRIGEFDWFKALEVARIGYRANMNSLFACGVISSRINTIVELKELIGQKVKNKKNSEILDSLKKEWDKLIKTSNTLKCKPQQKEEIMIGITNTATYQYCRYRHYLGYLDSNVNASIRNVQEIEAKIGKWSGTTLPTNTEEWVKITPKYATNIQSEIIRADNTLPKAIKTLAEMDQTYGSHILLILIYDDYVQLRKALSAYMNLSSQLYQKAYNAQSTNK